MRSRLDFVSVTASPRMFPRLWGQVQRTARAVKTTFDIPSDGTRFVLRDESRVTSGAAASQVAVGYNFPNHISAAAAYIHVPQRVSMPRFLIGYNIPIGRLTGEVL